MSDGDTAEPLQVNGDEFQVTLSVKWSKRKQPLKYKYELEKVLQSWANKNPKFSGALNVLNASEGSAVIRIASASGAVNNTLRELETLSGQTLTARDGETVRVMSVSLQSSPTQLETQTPDYASMEPASLSLSDGQHEQVPLGEQGQCSSSAAHSAAEDKTCTCSIPVGYFWYVNHICRKEINQIEKNNGVKITADVKVTLDPHQKDGDPQKALSEFTRLVQKTLAESDGFTVPLWHIDSDGWRDMLKIIQKNENRLLLTVASELMTICGPSQSQDAIRQFFNQTQKPLTNNNTLAQEFAGASQENLLTIAMSIKDPLVDAGLTMEESLWRQMTTSFNNEVAEVKAKFGVDFKESGAGHRKVTVKTCYKGSEGHVSMESHALRALHRLYLTIMTSPLRSNQQHGASDFGGSPKSLSNDNQSEGASRRSVSNGQSGYDAEGPTEGAAIAGNSEDDTCPICMDTFTNKYQLKCKHEFCEECLRKAKNTTGPICPVCKDVYGVMEGDQPPGRMSWKTLSSCLPGYSRCGTIVISYIIHNGRQTEKHPNPGQHYHGFERTAYLPDNNEGKEVLHLLRKAFDQKLIFTVGTSRTTGIENQVTWNDIHHKTSTTGGPENFGYPDPYYLSRVREELNAKGIR